jgi:CHASE1-domain containing sensor protein
VPARKPRAARDTVVSGASAVRPGRAKRLRVWMLVAVVVAVGGIAAAVVSAGAVAASGDARSREQFKQASTEVASTLQLAVQREQDLVVAASGFVIGNPNASNAQFVVWAKSIHALARYPELNGFGHSVIVPAGELPAFAAQAVKDPVGPLAANGTFEVIPPGRRAFYCLSVGSLSRSAQAAFPAGFDFCASQAGPTATASVSSRDSGQSSYLPIRAGKVTLLAILTPVYRNGATPATVAGRRRTFLGWVGMSLVPEVLLARALQGHPDTAVSFRYHAGPWNAVFRSGKAPSNAQSTTIALHNGWTVETFTAAASAGIVGNDSALALLIAGIALSLALSVLVLVLGTSRARALRLVELKTRELASARDDAVEASNAKSVFVATVSHELRTPLSGVIGTAELLLETELDAEQHEYAEIVRSSSEGLLLVINDILDYSKIEAGKLELDPSAASRSRS